METIHGRTTKVCDHGRGALPLVQRDFARNCGAAQGYPNRLIKLVVPYVAGGPIDIVARTVADKLSISLKRSIVIENRVGAGGNIGTEVIARAAPDGYTLGIVLGSTLAANPSLYKKVPFDPDKDFRPLSILTMSGMMLGRASVCSN